MKKVDKDRVRSGRAEARALIEGVATPSRELNGGVRLIPEETRVLAGNVSGYNVTSTSRLLPRVANRDLESMLQGTDEVHYSDMEMLASSLFKPGSKSWLDYVAIRVALRRRRSDGTGEYCVVRNTFPPYLPPSALCVQNVVTKVKTYQLAQFFSDGAVVEKYSLSPSFIRDMQLLAINKPADAAVTVQAAVQKKSKSAKIRVTAGMYADSKSRCIAIIRDAALQVKKFDPYIDARVIGDQIFMYGEPYGETKKKWNIHGPVWRADTLKDIYVLIDKAGVQQIGILYAYEMEMLRIYIHDGEAYVSGKFIGNVGDGEMDEVPEDNELLYRSVSSSVLTDLARVATDVLPVTREGKQVASAVRVSGSMVLVNQHVVADGVCMVAGVSLMGGAPVGHDLWAYEVSGFHEPWKIRGPVVGESVVLMLSNRDQVIKSVPFQVDKVDGTNILFRKVLGIGKGTSGAAVVALSDGALLGLHSGMTDMYMIATQFSHTMMRDMQDWEVDRKRVTGQRDFGSEVLAQMTRRGANKAFVSALECVLPLSDVDRVCVGTAMLKDCKLFSTVPSGMYYVGKSDRLCEFVPHTGMYSVCDTSDEIADLSPVLTRQPENYERVVIVGSDQEGLFLTNETVVRQVAVGKKNFMVESTDGNVFSLTGAVVIAMQDGAVLGQFVNSKSSVAVGKLSLCCTVLRSSRVESVDVVVELKRLFPILNPAAWEDGIVDQIVTHPSLQKEFSMTSLARVGDAVSRTYLMRNLWRVGHKGTAQDLVEKYQSNVALAEVAWQTGLAKLIKLQEGIVPSASSKVYADLVEAMIGAVWVCETSEVFELFLDGIGVVPEVAKLRNGGTGVGSLVRRPSEQVTLRPSVVNVEEDVLRTPVEW